VSVVSALNGNRVLRVGHKGADLIAPGNTQASFDAALEAGVDMIEFDILPERDGDGLILAHDYEDAAGRTPHTLEEGLAHLASDRFSAIGLDVDLKLRGYELRVVDALREHGLLERALISSTYRSSLALIRAADPTVRLGWSVPRAHGDPLSSPWLRLPTLALLRVWQEILPGQAAAAIRSGRCDAMMVMWHLITPRLVRSVNAAGGELYAWTVDEPEQLRSLEALGVNGLITNDPRLFASRAD
jgi:glycerophosphoryl diester phosphodiesterase